jgi:hypothetical protein
LYQAASKRLIRSLRNFYESTAFSLSMNQPSGFAALFHIPSFS